MRCGYASCLVTSLFALSMASVEPAVAASDTTPPQLTAFSFTPSAVDVSTGAQSVIVNATITDCAPVETSTALGVNENAVSCGGVVSDAATAGSTDAIDRANKEVDRKSTRL